MVEIINAKAICGLRQLEDKSINMCVTSPPYFNLRDYGCEGQIGLEATPEEYIQKLVEVFREVKRVLKDDGTLWINIADSYAGSGKNRNGDGSSNKSYIKNKQGTNQGSVFGTIPKQYKDENIKPKDLIGIPWKLAFALRNDGWYLRQDIIWAKPNPMPESVKDRCTKSHEYIFLLSKSRKYYFDSDAIKEPCLGNENANGFRGGAYCNNETFDNSEGGKRKVKGNYKIPSRTRYGGKKYTDNPEKFFRTKSGNLYKNSQKRNKRDVWFVSTQPYKEAHFATFPVELIRPCILAGSRKGDTVLDPFFDSGTTGVVCEQEERNCVGIDIKKEYIELAKKRIAEEKYKVNKENMPLDGQLSFIENSK